MWFFVGLGVGVIIGLVIGALMSIAKISDLEDQLWSLVEENERLKEKDK